MKKVLALTLTVCLLLSCTSLAFADYSVDKQIELEDSGYWGYNGSTVLIDEYSCEQYDMKAYYDGEIVYVISVYNDGEVNFVWAPIHGTVRSITFDSQELSVNTVETAQSINRTFAETAKAYSLANANESKIIDITAPETSISPNAYVQSDYNYLMSQVQNRFGSEYTWYDWTGMSSQNYNGLTFQYKENLSYELMYRDSYAFSQGMRIAEFYASLLAEIPSLETPFSVIEDILGAFADINDYLLESGVIANYYGSAVYSRYVLIGGGGPYYQCYQTVDYDGWSAENDGENPTFVVYDPYYNPTQAVFNSYTMQRTNALNSYN